MTKKRAIKRSPAGKLFKDICQLIDHARQRVAKTVNTELAMMYWSVGKRVQIEILKNKRAGYGEEIIQKLSEQLIEQYGLGWSKRQVWNCVRTAYTFSQKDIVHALRSQLSWTHIRTLISIEDTLKRKFYLEMSRNDRWSSRQLQERIDSMLHERTALSKKPEKLIKQELAILHKQGPVTTDLVFKDPYFLDFLGLQDVYSEKDLESAIIIELQKFIIELGSDFAFIARQKRIIIDGDDQNIDLLFYHRALKRLVVIDLKLRKFKAGDKGQMELYLRWLEKYEMREGENEPVGLILCADKGDEYVELLMMEDSRIKVAQYLTALPSKKLLQQKLHRAVEIAKAKFPGNTKKNNDKRSN